MSNICKFLLISIFLLLVSCSKSTLVNDSSYTKPKVDDVNSHTKLTNLTPKKIAKRTNDAKVIHILVALCDNENQGIVPVPKHLGNGDDPKGNLYWGAAYGVKTFFTKSQSWQKIKETKKPNENVLERIVFKHKNKNVYLVADAYRGIKIKSTIEDFFSATSGEKLENVTVQDKTIQIFGSANLVSFVGHNGLMDFDLDKKIVKKDSAKREAIILACLSKKYFAEHLKQTGAKPLVWTTNLMAPEAYILHEAFESWINDKTDEEIRISAAKAYSKYQKISLRASKRLLVTGL